MTEAFCRHLLKDTDLNSEELIDIINVAWLIKRRKLNFSKILEGFSIGLLFEKPSLRTRVSTQTACAMLGANSVILRGDELHLHRGETPEDSAQVLSGYIDLLMGRVLSHSSLQKLASVDAMPIVNGLCDKFHPLQALADMLTIAESFNGIIKGINLLYLGDGNNVANSLLLSGAMFGINVNVCTPEKYKCDSEIVTTAEKLSVRSGSTVLQSFDPLKSIKNADVVYTDVWVSMGDESEESIRIAEFNKYQINSQLMKDAPPHSIILHCLPAHFDQEITREVFDSDQARIFNQAHNRLPIAASVFFFLLKKEKFNEIASLHSLIPKT